MQVNGEHVTLETPISVADYLSARGYRPELVAVELDGRIVPRARRADTMLTDGSVMEIVQIVQGG